MKTQLLEDIGESAELPAAPPAAIAHPPARAGGHVPAGAVNAEPVKPVRPFKPLRPRSAPGVWRTRPVLVPLAVTVEEQDLALAAQEPPEPAALEHVFEEIAALEAQLVHPTQPDIPDEAPATSVAPDHTVPAAPGLRADPVPVTPLSAPFSLEKEDPTHPDLIEQTAAPHGPLFYFAEPEPQPGPAPHPAPAAAEASLSAPALTAPARRGGKYVLGTACLLSVALLAMGGMGARSLYQERSDAASSAAVGAQTKASAPPLVRAAADKPAAPTAPPAATLPDVPAPGEPYVFEDRPAPDLPPLVMLEPDPPAPVVPAAAAASAVVEKAQPVVVKPEPVRTVVSENIAPKAIVPKPILPKPVSPKPVVAKATVAKPIPAKPVVARPVAVKPVTRPIMAKPITPKVAVPRTLASRPTAAKPAAAKPPAPKEIVRKAAQAVRQVVAAPAPAIRKERAASRRVSQSAQDLPEPGPLRPFAEVVVALPPRQAEPDTSMEATLRACREHGYHEMQCIRRECSMTAYGFACRGR